MAFECDDIKCLFSELPEGLKDWNKDKPEKEEASAKVWFTWIVSFFETNQVIIGEEGGLDDSVVILLVSYVFFDARGHKSIHPDQSPQFSYLRLKLQAVGAWNVGGTLVGKKMQNKAGILLCHYLSCKSAWHQMY